MHTMTRTIFVKGENGNLEITPAALLKLVEFWEANQ